MIYIPHETKKISFLLFHVNGGVVTGAMFMETEGKGISISWDSYRIGD